MSKAAVSRRNLLKGISAAVGFVGIDLVLPRLVNSAAVVETVAQEAEPWYRWGIIGDDLMDERLLWFMSHTWERMADLGECLDTANRIEPGSSQSWMREWFATADRVRTVGDASLAKGHTLSAGESYLRATNYYLAGLMYGETPEDPEIVPRAEASRETFTQALDLLGIPGEYVEIPYEDSALPAYFFRSPLATDKAPVLIVHQGMDASVEENLWLAQESIKRGYHALLFHHPGQGLALRLKGLHFRPDWENVITPVIDWLVAQPEIDPARIMLMGNSFGGALVVRAAAFEKRIKIVIANPPVYSWYDFLSTFLFGQYPEMGQLLDSDPDAFNDAITQFLDAAPALYQWWFKAATWKYGATSPADLILKFRDYTLADVVGQVEATVLIMDGEGETWAAGEAMRVYDALNSPKEYMLFTAEDTGLLHCQTGAMAVATQRMFDWVDEHI